MTPILAPTTIRLSEKMIPGDPRPMDYEFPSQTHLDSLMKNDQKALSALELKSILNNDDGNAWNFILNDGTKSDLDSSGL
jgi:hypothetical protein